MCRISGPEKDKNDSKDVTKDVADMARRQLRPTSRSDG